jgi:hypothetical protein
MARIRETRQLPLVVSDRPVVPERIEWLHSELLKTRVAHGYCSRHLAAEACPYANICEQCENYTTSTEFLPQIEAQMDDMSGSPVRDVGCLLTRGLFSYLSYELVPHLKVAPSQALADPSAPVGNVPVLRTNILNVVSRRSAQTTSGDVWVKDACPWLKLLNGPATCWRPHQTVLYRFVVWEMLIMKTLQVVFG